MSRDQVVEAYLRGDLSRRLFVRRLVAVGVSLTAALAYAEMAPAPASAAKPDAPGTNGIAQACLHVPPQVALHTEFCGA